MVWNTGSSSPGELEMTFSTSAVAVCCCSDSRNSLSSRVFSMAITAWEAKFVHQLDLLVGERPRFLAVNADRADQFVFLQHRYVEERPGAPMRRSGKVGRRLLPPKGPEM